MTWADCNPEIWGNACGYEMFCSTYAFCTNDYGFAIIVTVADIVSHWRAVADRLEERA